MKLWSLYPFFLFPFPGRPVPVSSCALISLISDSCVFPSCVCCSSKVYNIVFFVSLVSKSVSCSCRTFYFFGLVWFIITPTDILIWHSVHGRHERQLVVELAEAVGFNWHSGNGRKMSNLRWWWNCRGCSILSLQSVRKSATGDFVLILSFVIVWKGVGILKWLIDWTVVKRFILCRDLVVVSLTCACAWRLHLYEDGYNQCWSGICRCAPGLSILVARTLPRLVWLKPIPAWYQPVSAW